jgi:hypothetical protein
MSDRGLIALLFVGDHANDAEGFSVSYARSCNRPVTPNELHELWLGWISGDEARRGNGLGIGPPFQYDRSSEAVMISFWPDQVTGE